MAASSVLWHCDSGICWAWGPPKTKVQEHPLRLGHTVVIPNTALGWGLRPVVLVTQHHLDSNHLKCALKLPVASHLCLLPITYGVGSDQSFPLDFHISGGLQTTIKLNIRDSCALHLFVSDQKFVWTTSRFPFGVKPGQRELCQTLGLYHSHLDF